MNWNQYFMSMAFLVAMKSKDQNTHHGAVIIGPDNEIISTGYNSFCRGANDDLPERQERPEKYLWFEHAERNAIYNAARIGAITKGCTMYVTGIPCMDCARGIVQSGIKNVYMCINYSRGDYEKWQGMYDKTLKLFEECGLNTFCNNEKLTRNISIRLNGEDL